MNELQAHNDNAHAWLYVGRYSSPRKW